MLKIEGLLNKGIRITVLALLSLLLVPVQAQDSILPYPLDTIDGEEVYKYEVERSIGLYRIGVNFHVPQSEIIRLNPQLRERGLHFGETLLIPTGRPVVKKTEQSAVREETVVPEQKDTKLPEQQETIVPEPKDIVVTEHQETIASTDTTVVPDSIVPPVVTPVLPRDSSVVELALLLPFESQQTKRSGSAERMLEFYQGALLALYDIQNDSTSGDSVRFRLRVYDCERSERRVNSLCDSTELDNVRGMIGLVYPIQIERMAAWCDVHQVPLLLPFSDNTDLKHHPQLLQFNSTDRQAADSLCNWMVQHDSLLHCVTVDVRDADMVNSVRTLRKQMNAHKIASKSLPLRNLLIDSAAYALDTTKENLIILHSDRYQHVRIVLPHLSKLQEQGYKLRIVSQYSWQKENIDLPQVYTSMFTAETDREAYDNLWEKYYITNHVSDAPRYDLLGYDLMKALVGRLRGEQETNGLQSVIRWEQIEDGGYQNACVKVIEK